MLELNECSTSELEYLHAIWSAEILTTQRNIEKRRARLRKRTEICRQESALKRAVQQRLDDARTVLQALIDTAVNPEIIRKQREIVRDHEAAVEEVAMLGQRADARDLQKELLELTKLETSIEILTSKVREVEALLAPTEQKVESTVEIDDEQPEETSGAEVASNKRAEKVKHRQANLEASRVLSREKRKRQVKHPLRRMNEPRGAP